MALGLVTAAAAAPARPPPAPAARRPPPPPPPRRPPEARQLARLPAGVLAAHDAGVARAREES